MKNSYDAEFVREIQGRHNWPIVWGPGPFKEELEGRVAITFFGGSIETGRMMVQRPEYDSLPADIRAKLGTPLTALDEDR